MPPVGFEPTIAAGERPKTYALDRAATGTGSSGKSDSVNWQLVIDVSGQLIGPICWTCEDVTDRLSRNPGN